MSSAFYPLGMNSMPSSGYNHKSSYFNKQYIPWKGTGINSNPVGTAASHIRPLTNNDPGNVFQTGFGLPRPIKHYRKGRVIPPNPGPDHFVQVKNPYNSNINLTINEGALINYNTNRFVKSSNGTSLGGGFGGSGLLNDMQDKPGSYIVKINTPTETDGVSQMNKDCKTCEGIAIVSDYYPNETYLTENPQSNTCNKILCCNQEIKAKRRSLYASTNLKKNYYTTTKEYLQNRCKTYDQKAFNFLSYRTNLENNIYENDPYYAAVSMNNNNEIKPGSPESLANTYLANCQVNAQLYEGSQLSFINKMLDIMLQQNIITNTDLTQFTSTGINNIEGFFKWIQNLPVSPINKRDPALQIFEQFINNPYSGMPPSGPSNPTGCQLTIYKPNNYQYAKQGAVSSSTKMLKLNVDTISTNAASIQNYKNSGSLITANQLYAGDNNNYMNLLKNKGPTCGTPLPLDFKQSGPYQNKKFCQYNKLRSYQNPVSRLGTYRYFPGVVSSSNHYSQSPNSYNVNT